MGTAAGVVVASLAYYQNSRRKNYMQNLDNKKLGEILYSRGVYKSLKFLNEKRAELASN